MALAVKTLPASAGDLRDTSSAPELGRSPGEGNGSSRLENPMDAGAWVLRSMGSQKTEATEHK